MYKLFSLNLFIHSSHLQRAHARTRTHTGTRARARSHAHTEREREREREHSKTKQLCSRERTMNWRTRDQNAYINSFPTVFTCIYFHYSLTPGH